MGCMFSGPLKQTTSGTRIPVKAEESDGEAEEGNQIRRYFSFGSFLADSENPMILEWTFQREIGKGAMSRVFLSTNTETNRVCAAKVYNTALLGRQTLGNEESPAVAVQREIDIMMGIRHRYVLPIVEVIDDECSNSLILMLPWAKCGTLQSFIDNEPPTELGMAICFYEVAVALKYVHARNIVHRDLKPDNVLVFSPTKFALSDFSVSTEVKSDDELLVDTRGSPAFLSPEECGGEPFYAKPADVWAYGVTMFSCIYNFLPFNLDQGQGKSVANTVFAVTQLLNTEELVVPEDRGFSPHLAELFKQVLDKDPLKRPSFEEIVKSPWFDQAHDVDRRNEEEEENEMCEEEAVNEEECGNEQPAEGTETPEVIA